MTHLNSAFFPETFQKQPTKFDCSAVKVILRRSTSRHTLNLRSSIINEDVHNDLQELKTQISVFLSSTTAVLHFARSAFAAPALKRSDTSSLRLPSMLSQLSTIPPPLDIKKYHTDDYPLTSKLGSSTAPFYTNISHLVSAPMSSGHSSSPANSVDDDLPSPRSPTGGSVICGHGNPSSESLNPTTPPPSVYQSTSQNVQIRSTFDSEPSAHDAYNINTSFGTQRLLKLNACT